MKWIGRMKAAFRPKAGRDAAREAECALPLGDRPAALTPREREVLALLVQGKKQREIAAHLNVRPTTVSFHRQSLYRKLEVHDRAQLILRYALPGRAMPSNESKEGKKNEGFP